jgi:hypothetical protein
MLRMRTLAGREIGVAVGSWRTTDVTVSVGGWNGVDVTVYTGATVGAGTGVGRASRQEARKRTVRINIRIRFITNCLLILIVIALHNLVRIL